MKKRISSDDSIPIRPTPSLARLEERISYDSIAPAFDQKNFVDLAMKITALLDDHHRRDNGYMECRLAMNIAMAHLMNHASYAGVYFREDMKRAACEDLAYSV